MLQLNPPTVRVDFALLGVEPGFTAAELRWFEQGERASAADARAAEELDAFEAEVAERGTAPSARLPMLACVALTGLMWVGLPLVKWAQRPALAVVSDSSEVQVAKRPAPVPAPVLDPAALKARARLVKAEVRVNAALAVLEKERAQAKHKATAGVRKAQAKLKASRADAQQARAAFLAASR